MKNEGKNLCFSTPGFVFYYQTFCSLVLSIKFVTQLFFYIFFCFLFLRRKIVTAQLKSYQTIYLLYIFRCFENTVLNCILHIYYFKSVNFFKQKSFFSTLIDRTSMITALVQDPGKQ